MIKTRDGDVISGGVQKIYRRKELSEVTGLNGGYLYELIAEGRFPKPINLNKRAVGWLADDIAQWQSERIAARDAGTK